MSRFLACVVSAALDVAGAALQPGKTPTGVTLPDPNPAPPLSGTPSPHVLGIALG